jgi:hypothetical protein
MKYDLVKPCDSCPFRIRTTMRLTRHRAVEISSMMLDSQGGTFPCHKTVDYSENDEPDTGEQHCAGALIFAEKHQVATQMMRIAERLGIYDHKKLLPYHHLVFSSMPKLVAWLTRDRLPE